MSKRISELTDAGTLTGDEDVPLSRESSVTYTATTISFDPADNSLNDSASQFVAEGFLALSSVRISGAANGANNLYTGRISTITAGKIVIAAPEGDDIVTEAAGASVTITMLESVRTTVSEIAAAAGAGDVSAASSLTDNALVRGDGGVKGVQTSGVLVDDDNKISGYRGNTNTQTGTTYTLDAADTGKIVELSNASAIALTLPATAAVGFACTLVQAGAGQVSFASSGSGVVRNRQSHAKLAGQWAMASVYVRANSGGSAAEWVISGDTAT